MTAPLVNFDAIERSKENIAPAPRGRSAVALAKAFDVSAASPHDVRSQHASTRAKFEHDIASSTDLDDPLDVWVRYIKWTDETFPSGQSTESGIARLLERCTLQFKNDRQYKSDPRYLRVWLAYSTYSDSPLEIFRFLQHHDIGQDLALYYEEHAAVLEKVNRKRKADQVFQIGLLREARPVDRLRRRYAEFQRRLETSPPDAQEPTTPPAPLRKVLGTAQPLSTASAARGGSTLGPRPKMQVFTDTEEPEGPPGSAGWESIGTLAERKKENSMAPKPWAGEKLPMKGSSAASTGDRLVVFRDEAHAPKRNHEHVAVNLEAIYVDSEEFSFEELLAKKRGIYGVTAKHAERPTSPTEPVFKPLVLKSPENIFPSKPSPLQLKSDVKTPSPKPSVSFQVFKSTDEDEVVSVPIRGNGPFEGTGLLVDEDSTPRKTLKKRPSPTINTKAALDDIIDIFSQPLKSQQELDEADESSSDDESDAASLTTRSFGDNPDVDDLAPTQDVEEEDEVSVAHVAEQIATVEISTENQVPAAVEPQNLPPPPSQADATPPQQFAFPEQHERRFNVNLMTPIEERTETSIFQHSQDDSSFFQSPLPSSHQQPRFQKPQPQTPLRQVPSSNTILNSSPFEEYIPKPRPTALKKPLPAKRPTPTTPHKKSATPTGPIIKEDQCNPQDFALQKQIFDALRPAIDTYDGYHATEHETFNKAPSIERFIRALSTKEPGQTQALEMRIHLGPTEYLIRRKLGQGAYAPVFLAECAQTGELRAIKVEKSPPRKWEFYLMRQAKRRLGVSRAAEGMIDVLGLHLFRDESYLVLEYRDQGTILALVNAVKVAPIGDETTGVMDEVLAMFFTVELLRTVEGLHAKGILHGDLKPDNCLVRLDEADLPHPYRRDGSHNWSKKGVALIDFGRGIDMTLFPASVRFIADWKTDEQDCPEMREMRPWTHQVDYWGLAGIIHSMLFGKYISVRWEPVGTGKKRWFLREGLKRYWQGEMWKEVLDVLMNPVLVVAEGGLGVPERLRGCRERMEGWLEENSERGVGLRAMIRRIENRS